MKSHSRYLLTTLMALLLIASACGSSSNDTATESDASEATTDTTVTDADADDSNSDDTEKSSGSTDAASLFDDGALTSDAVTARVSSSSSRHPQIGRRLNSTTAVG